MRAKMRTISITDFKNLVGADSSDAIGLTGTFGISIKSQVNQCENLKVGDTVFFLDAVYVGLSEDNIPKVDVTIVQAKVVNG